MEPTNALRVVELFAGVGGFRIGLERSSPAYQVVWSNQWEPSTKKQGASDIYVARFGAKGHSNEDIALVKTQNIPDHELLVGGFPCQDYSVARTLKLAEGLSGKKGVLWWEIHRILKEKQPPYLFLENVDRLLKSPVKQRGRDFAVMLTSLSDLGYAVEWRVVNAADYGMPQRRRRLFFLGYHRSTPMGKALWDGNDPEAWLLRDGVFAQAFPCTALQVYPAIKMAGNLADISEQFNNGKAAGSSPFHEAGTIVDRSVRTIKTLPDYTGPRTTLGDILVPEAQVDPSYFVAPASTPQWKYLKGGKQETRTHKETGFTYRYAEGSMVFPDALDRPSRTIITAEGGTAPSRFKHVVQTKDGRFRRLLPVELERLNMFPDNHTVGASDSRRAFFMGNALVTGVIERVGNVLARRVAGDA